MRMMKAMLLAAVLVTGATAAQAANMTFGLTGQAAFPVSDFGDSYSTGYGGGVYGDYWIKPDYAFGADISGNWHTAKDDFNNTLNALPGVSGADAKVTIIQYGLHGMWLPKMTEAKAGPFVTYGVAMYNIQPTYDATGLSDPDAENKFGLNGGAGVNIRGGKAFDWGLVGKYHYIFTDDTATQYFTVGLNLTFKTSGE